MALSASHQHGIVFGFFFLMLQPFKIVSANPSLYIHEWIPQRRSMLQDEKSGDSEPPR
jgi:hypothetical protein